LNTRLNGIEHSLGSKWVLNYYIFFSDNKKDACIEIFRDIWYFRKKKKPQILLHRYKGAFYVLNVEIYRLETEIEVIL
jgi:hypothetical protein